MARSCRAGFLGRVEQAGLGWGAGFGQCGGCCQRGEQRQVGEYLPDNMGILSALASCFALHPASCSRMHAMTLTAPPHSPHVSVSMLKTRLSRCA